MSISDDELRAEVLAWRERYTTEFTRAVLGIEKVMGFVNGNTDSGPCSDCPTRTLITEGWTYAQDLRKKLINPWCCHVRDELWWAR